MHQGEENYFTLNNPSINNKPQSTTASILQPQESRLLNRRRQNSTHPIQPLELPPLSQLLPVTSNEPVAAAAATAAPVAMIAPNQVDLTQSFVDPTHTNDLFMTDPNSAVVVAAAINNVNDNLYNTYDPLVNPLVPSQQNVRQRQLSSSSYSSTEKQYSFVTIPGTNQKKRPRRRYDEIERLYHCTWQGCSKAYGTLNHLNAHVSMQKHGPKRQPSEFREMRKEWRRQKKEREAQRKRQEELINQQSFLNTNSITQQQQVPLQFNQAFPLGDPLNGFF